MSLTTFQFVLIYLGFFYGMIFGWRLWHMNKADFFEQFCGTYIFFGMLLCFIIFLFCHLSNAIA